MKEMFLKGGIMMWPLLAVGVGILVLAVRAAVRLRAAGRPESRDGEDPRLVRGEPSRLPANVDRSLQAILFWGAMAVLLGLLGTVVGVVVMTQAIALAGSVEPPLVWSGVGVSLVTLVFGLLVFLLAAFAWFGLRQWSQRLTVQEVPSR